MTWVGLPTCPETTETTLIAQSFVYGATSELTQMTSTEQGSTRDDLGRTAVLLALGNVGVTSRAA